MSQIHHFLRSATLGLAGAALVLSTPSAQAAGLIGQMRSFAQLQAQAEQCMPTSIRLPNSESGFKLTQLWGALLQTAGDYGVALKPGSKREDMIAEAQRLLGRYAIQAHRANAGKPCPFQAVAALDGFIKRIDMRSAIVELRSSGLELLPYDKPQSFIVENPNNSTTFAYPETQSQLLGAVGNGSGIEGACPTPVVLKAETTAHDPEPNVRNLPAFVLPPVRYEETWSVKCGDATLKVDVKFIQDSDGGVGQYEVNAARSDV